MKRLIDVRLPLTVSLYWKVLAEKINITDRTLTQHLRELTQTMRIVDLSLDEEDEILTLVKRGLELKQEPK